MMLFCSYDYQQTSLLMHCFSLHVNSVTLDEANNILFHMIRVLYSRYVCRESQQSYEVLKKAVERDGCALESGVCLDLSTAIEESKHDPSGDTADSNDEALSSRMCPKSPFKTHFQKIVDKATKDISGPRRGKESNLFLPEVMDDVIKMYLPVYPLWSGVFLSKSNLALMSITCSSFMNCICFS